MKLENGTGSVFKLSGKRRKPFAVVVTTGFENGKQCRKLIGTATKYKEAITMLIEYNKNPYDVDLKNLTVNDVWNSVEKKLEKAIDNKTMSDSNYKVLSSAYKNHCEPLHNKKVLDIKFKEMQNLIDNAKKKNGEPLGSTAKGNIRTVFIDIFDCAKKDYDLPIIINPAIGLECGKKDRSQKHIPFSDEELSILWGIQYNDIAKIILILCYTGTRPNEIFTCKKENIFIDDDYIISGSKTEAGKDRVIPIHPKIKHLIKYFYNKDNILPFTSIIEKFNYGKFRRQFDKLMEELNFNHTPYDGRHTFITKMKEANADEYLLKLILGHRIEDVTEKYYTHRKIESIVKEVQKIR